METYGCDCRSVQDQSLKPYEEYTCKNCHRLWQVTYVRATGRWMWLPVEG